MDWVMIHFHKDRMKMINNIIRELWRAIYRGNDIDSIEIKTDESSSTSAGEWVFSYILYIYLSFRKKRKKLNFDF